MNESGSTFPVLKVDDDRLIEQNVFLGTIPLRATEGCDSIQSSLQAIADGALPPALCLHGNDFTTAIAVSYVHTTPQQWYGRVSRGKFSPDARQRLVADLQKRRSKALWLDQCLAQRRGDGDSGWAVIGLLPYATMPVLVVGNYAKLSVVIHAYLDLGRYEDHVLQFAAPRALELIKSASRSILHPSSQSEQEVEFIDFVQMCRFWPMMERAVAHKARGLFYEPHTLNGLRLWLETLKRARSACKEQEDGAAAQATLFMLKDMDSMVLNILLGDSGEDEHPGLGHNMLTSMAIVTAALGSGALANASLYQPQDRNDLLLAGMCFHLYTVLQSRRQLVATEVVHVIENPRRAFARLSERIPATFYSTSMALSDVNVLYNLEAIAESSVIHSTFLDEVTIFNQETARVPTSRKWLGQWELIPNLALCMHGQLLDIGERSMNSEPYDQFVLKNLMTMTDITGKGTLAAISVTDLSKREGFEPVIALSPYSVKWTLRDVEKKVIERELGGWTSGFMVLGLCNPQRRILLIEATVVVHLSVLELDLIDEGAISPPNSLKWFRALLRRSSSPIAKLKWIDQWISQYFKGDNDFEWYCPLSVPLHDFSWLKWAPRASHTTLLSDAAESTPTIAFVRVSCIGLDTVSTMPKVPVEDMIRFVQASMVLCGNQQRDETSSDDATKGIDQYLNRTFETWLGLLTGLYRRYELSNPVRRAGALQLMLPAFDDTDNFIRLSTSSILDPTGGYMQGLSRTVSPAPQISHEAELDKLHWDMSSSKTFWDAKEIVLHSAHAKGTFYTLMLLCLLSAAWNSGQIAPEHTQAETDARYVDTSHQLSEQVLVYQLKDATQDLAAKFVTYRDAQNIASSLLEFAIANARLGWQESRWAMPTATRDALHDCIFASSGSSDALASLAEDVCRSLNNVADIMQHVRQAEIRLSPGQTFTEATAESFERLLNVEGSSAGTERERDRDSTGPSLLEAVGIMDLDETVRVAPVARSAEGEEDVSKNCLKLVASFEFAHRR